MKKEAARLLALLSRIVSFKSITPRSNGCIEYIASLLAHHNFHVIIQESNNESSTTNLYASCPLKLITPYQGEWIAKDTRYTSELEYEKQNFQNTKWWELNAGQQPSQTNCFFNLCFAGHIDVVPPGDLALWPSNPFALYQKDGMLYARGIADMKGAVASSICAVFRVLDMLNAMQLQNIDTPLEDLTVSFLLTSDEEGTGEYGLRQMLPLIHHLGYAIDLAILGEPTSRQHIGDLIKIGRRGSSNFDLIIHGKQGHVAYPELCINPNTILVKFLNELITHKIDDGTPLFQPSNLEITSIDCDNNLTNVIPNSARARFNIRFNTLHTHQSLRCYVEEKLLSLAPNIDYDLTHSTNHFAFAQDGELKLIQKVLNIVKQKRQTHLSTSGGVSDACYLSSYCPVVEIGLKHESTHKPAECASLKDLEDLVDIYSDIIIQIREE